MIKAVLFDFSRTLLKAKDENYGDSLNSLYKRQKQSPEYNPLDDFELNQELLDFAASIKNTYPLYIFTTGIIQEDVKFKSVINSIFKQVFTVSEVGYAKDSKEAYVEIAHRINVKPEEIMFIDDEKDNVDAAKGAGLETVHYESAEQVKEVLA